MSVFSRLRASLISVAGILLVSGCLPPLLSSEANVDTGVVMLSVSGIAPWVNQDRGASDFAPTAYLVASGVDYYVYDSDGLLVDSILSVSGNTVTEWPVPAGGGYTIHADVYNNAVSSHMPVVAGTSDEFSVSPSATTAVVVRCTPVSPTMLISGESSDGHVLAAGAERWFAFTASSLSADFTVTSSGSSDTGLYVFDGNGGFLASHDSVQPQDTVTVWTAPGSMYYAGIFEYASGSGSFSVLAEDISVAPGIVDDTYYAYQWHYDAADVPDAWSYMLSQPTDFQETVIAVLDTGYLPHPDLLANIATDGYDFVDDLLIANDGDGRDPDPTDPGDSATEPSWHGTHVSGTIAAVTNNATGVAGIGLNSLKVLPLRVLGVDYGLTADIVEAVLYAAAEPNASGAVPSSSVSVINMSLGGGSYSQAFYDAIGLAVSKGIAVVCASGNTGSSGVQYPAAYDNTIAIGSVAENLSLAYYSTYGPEVDFVGPGGDYFQDSMVLSTWRSGYDEYTYGFMQGTSMAVPHVSAIAGILYAHTPQLDQSGIRSLLASSSIDLGVTGKDNYYGLGLVQADAALEQLILGAMPPGLLGTVVAPSEHEIRSRIESEMLGGGQYSPNTIIVRLREGVVPSSSPASIADRFELLGVRNGVMPLQTGHTSIRLARLLDGDTPVAAIRRLMRDPAVLYAEPNYYVYAQ